MRKSGAGNVPAPLARLSHKDLRPVLHAPHGGDQRDRKEEGDDRCAELGPFAGQEPLARGAEERRDGGLRPRDKGEEQEREPDLAPRQRRRHAPRPALGEVGDREDRSGQPGQKHDGGPHPKGIAHPTVADDQIGHDNAPVEEAEDQQKRQHH